MSDPEAVKFPRTVKTALLQAGLDIDDPATFNSYVAFVRWGYNRFRSSSHARARRAKFIVVVITAALSTLTTGGVTWLISLIRQH